jgi:uncharacterized protein (TIGR03086 family)
MSTTAGADIRDLDARAVRATVALVSPVTAADLTRSTPCAGWTLGDLLAHMTAQHRGFAAAAAGDAGDLAHWQVRPLGDDPAGTYAAAAAEVVTAFHGDDVPERRFVLPELATGHTFPAAQAISFHFIDYVVHAWDVARSLDRPLEFDPDVLAAALAVARQVPDGERRHAPGAAFRPAVPAPPRAGPLDQVVAWLGRSPTWPA